MNNNKINLLITGGCGFIGSNYINFIFKKVNKLINLDAMYYCASIYNINKKIRDDDNYILVKGNLNNYNLLTTILKEHNITHIIHFAAQSHVDNSFNESLQYTYDNVTGTHTLLEAIKNTDLNIILLHISTDEVYGESTHNEMTEKSLLCPTNPYSASKAAAEMYVYSYIKSYNLKAIITRGNNVFGPNQYPEKLIPKFIKLLREGGKCTIQGTGENIRNFIYVDDVCTAIETILNKGCFGHVYNIGSDHCYEKSVIEITKILIEKICKTTDYNNYIEYIEDRPFNDCRYLISNEKLKDLEWKQTINFDEGLEKVINYYDNTCIILLRIVKNKNDNNIFNSLYTKIKNKYFMNIYILCDSNYNNVNNYINVIKYEKINNIITPLLFLCENKYDYGIIIDKNTDIDNLIKNKNYNKITDKNLLINMGYEKLLNKYITNNKISIIYNKNKILNIKEKLIQFKNIDYDMSNVIDTICVNSDN
jgi:dTDP-glucose 4,6-dehydratase